MPHALAGYPRIPGRHDPVQGPWSPVEERSSRNHLWTNCLQSWLSQSARKIISKRKYECVFRAVGAAAKGTVSENSSFIQTAPAIQNPTRCLEGVDMNEPQGESIRENIILTITSLLLILLLTFHLADDIVRGYEKGGLSNLTAVPIVVVWLYATLLLAERRSGYIINLLLSLFS